MLRLSIGGTYKEVMVTDRAGFQTLRIMEIAHGCAASGAEYKVLKAAVGVFRFSPLQMLYALFPMPVCPQSLHGYFQKPPAFLSGSEPVWLCKKAYTS